MMKKSECTYRPARLLSLIIICLLSASTCILSVLMFTGPDRESLPCSCGNAHCECWPVSSGHLFAFPKEHLLNVRINPPDGSLVQLDGEAAEKAVELINSFNPILTEEGGAPIGGSYIRINYFDMSRTFSFNWVSGYEFININDTFYMGEPGCFDELKELVDSVPLTH